MLAPAEESSMSLVRSSSVSSSSPLWPRRFQRTSNSWPPYPFFPPFLRDSAGVLGGEGERLLFLLLAELALRSLRSGVRED
ncbi:hypothetical protein EYF80_033090 [Liparis tanakae]|uniref:Uncharacterized protein n=1 Tax=Liparis tanakae TaxID=230148 RepID=A0A4Z2GV91_9TELE|nr:hypothetical protein EYF80_033090 [Liparis tanakae]